MQSYIGSFKAVSRCIPQYASLLPRLEDAIKGIEGSQKNIWDKALLHYFNTTQAALRNPQTLTIRQVSDHFTLTVGASPMNKGLGATLFVNRSGKCHIAQFFSFKLKENQLNWYPCELEALAIATSVKHFAAYICELIHPMKVLSDSKPWSLFSLGQSFNVPVNIFF